MTGSDRGFTLLELLVVIVVFGLILAEIGQGLDFGVRAFTTQQALLSRHADLDSVDRLLRGLIERMDPGSGNTPPHPAGTSTEFAFTTELPLGAAGQFTRLVDASLSLSGKRLVLRWVPHVHVGSQARAAPSESVLLSGVTDLHLSYLIPAGATDPGWRDQWSEPFLPRLVRIHVGFDKSDPRHWPDIVAAPVESRPAE